MRHFLTVPLLLFALTACDESGGGALKAGDAAPAFTLRHLDGRTVAFPQDFAGKVVALRFWADWCQFCRQEMTDIEPIYLKHKTEGLVVLAVNVGQDLDTVEKFTKSLGISYDVLLDGESEVAHAYRVLGLPTTFFIDRNGAVQGKILGESDAKVFGERVRKHL